MLLVIGLLADFYFDINIHVHDIRYVNFNQNGDIDDIQKVIGYGASSNRGLLHKATVQTRSVHLRFCSY